MCLWGWWVNVGMMKRKKRGEMRKVWAFIKRDFYVQASYRLNFVGRLARVLVLMAVFYFISATIDSAVGAELGRYGGSYFNFVLLGIAFYPFISLSTDMLSQVIYHYQKNGTLEILFLSPTPALSIFVMSTLWRYLWVLAEALFYLTTANLIFGASLAWGNIALALLVVVLVIFANAGLSLMNAGVVIITKEESPLVKMLALLTTLLAGTYYPVEVLPIWLQQFSHLLPATYAFRALREALLRGEGWAGLQSELLALLIFTGLLLPLGWLIFHASVRWAKVDGSLSQY
jgi:ABC-2 type transport system permease protein